MPHAEEITAATARSAKATKSLDTMRARILKADEARTDAAHEARTAQVAEAATEAATDNREAAEAWDALATHAAKQAGAGRTHAPPLAPREVMQWRAAPGPVACRLVVPVCSQDHPPHFHVWRIAATGQAAFLSRPYLNRSTAAHPAERWGLSRYRVVQTCGLHNECPRPPRRAHN